jgi:cellulose synthase/poly-beta-1,6-N-acetylglucosamine synthase-like glycosyltransferase
MSWVTQGDTAENRGDKRLSILICSLESRAEKLERLMDALTPQLTIEVEVLTHVDKGEASIGKKRNELMEAALGDYVAFVDDDDMVSVDYVEKVLTALDDDPDCASLTGIIYFANGKSEIFDHSVEHQEWSRGSNGVYYRSPNHLNAIRRSIASKVVFEDINFGEDKRFSDKVRPFLRKETRIPGEIYYYYPSRGY